MTVLPRFCYLIVAIDLNWICSTEKTNPSLQRQGGRVPGAADKRSSVAVSVGETICFAHLSARIKVSHLFGSGPVMAC